MTVAQLSSGVSDLAFIPRWPGGVLRRELYCTAEHQTLQQLWRQRPVVLRRQRIAQPQRGAPEREWPGTVRRFVPLSA